MKEADEKLDEATASEPAVPAVEPGAASPPPRVGFGDAINAWKVAQNLADEAELAAETAEATALLSAEDVNPKAKNDAMRKAVATISSAEAWKRAKAARAQERCAAAIVDFFLGGRAPIRRG